MKGSASAFAASLFVLFVAVCMLLVILAGGMALSTLVPLFLLAVSCILLVKGITTISKK